MFVSSRVRFAVPVFLIALALTGCSGAGRALPPAASAPDRTQLSVPPAPPSMQIPRRPSFVNTTPAQPSSAARTTSSTGHPAFFNGEAALSNGVYYLQLPNGNIFGYYSYLPDPHYIYHFDLGYEYVIDANDGHGGLYMYDFASGHWWYTGSQYPFPYAYDFTLSAFLYYYPDSNTPQHYTTSPRFFYNFTASQIVTIPSALPAPAVGFLGPASAGSLAGILNNVNSAVTFVGISGAHVQGGPGKTVPTASVAITYGPTVLSARREPQHSVVADSGPRTTPELPVEGPSELRKLTASLHRAPAGARSSSAVRRRSSLGTTVGSTNSFWVNTGAIGTNGSAYTQRTATLQAVTAHGYIWIDDSLNLTGNSVQAIAADFENGYASDTAHYGTASYSATSPGLAGQFYSTCDATGASDGNSAPVFITPTDNKVVAFVVDVQGLGTGVGGYFSSVNFYYQSALNCLIGHNGYTAQSVPRSNEAPMFVVGYNTLNEDAFETGEDLMRGTAHEFQHQINFVNHAILNNAGGGEDVWINEGMSMLAQDLAAQRMYPSLQTDVYDALYRARQYLTGPQNYSLTAFTGVSGGTQYYNCSGCYGAEYLFQRYMYDRFGGDAYLHKMLGQSLSYANLQQASGIDPTQAISDFAVAIAASGTGASSDPRFGLSLNLRSAYTGQFDDTTVLNGPATVPLAAGTNSYLVGSFFYMNADSSAGGKTVSAKDSSGAFNLSAAVVQR